MNLLQKNYFRVKKILKNKNHKLFLGNINIYRDWGWTPDFVEAYWLMLQKTTD